MSIAFSQDSVAKKHQWCVRRADKRNVTYPLDPRSRINR